MRYESDRVDLHANNDTTPLFIPVTPAILANDLSEVRFGFWLGAQAATGPLRVVPGIQFSNDGESWSVAAAVAVPGYSYVSAEGWSFPNTAFTDVHAVAGATTRSYVRFGFMCLSGSGVTATQSAQAILRIDAKPTTSGSVVVEQARVYSGSSSLYTFIPLTEPIPAADIDKIRATIEIFAPSGLVNVKVGFQTANKPEVPSDWSAATYITTDKNTVGVHHPTSYTSVTTADAYVRLGIGAKLVSGSVRKALLLAFRADYRRS